MKQKLKKLNKVMILIPMVILSIITYVVYLKNPVNSNIFVLNMILTVYVLYLGCLYLFLKEKEAIKYLLIYLLILQFFSYAETINYVSWGLLFPINIFKSMGRVMVATVLYPVYYYHTLESTYEYIIQNTILYITIVLFFHKYLKICQRKLCDIFLIFTIWVTLVNGLIGYRIDYFADLNEWYQHDILVLITFFLWLCVIYRQRKNLDRLRFLFQACFLAFMINVVFAVLLPISIVPGYFKIILKFGSLLTLAPFSRKGIPFDHQQPFDGIAFLCMAVLVIFCGVLKRKYSKMKSETDI